MSVRRLLAEMDSRELSEWHAYFAADAERRDEAIAARTAEREIMGE